MKTKITIGLAAATLTLAMASCGGANTDAPPGAKTPPPGAAATEAETKAPDNMITAADITLGDIDQTMASAGKGIYELKCQACHSVGTNRVVGPGWKGITERRKPEWIMNMMLNVDVMLDQDPEAQKMLEECLVRMPNQSLSKDDGRHVLESMRTL